MTVLLIRHVDAVAENPELRDDDRYLSAAGRRMAPEIGRSLLAAGIRLDGLVASPLARAVQTAELLGAAAGFAGIVEVLPDLAPGGDVHAVADRAGARTGIVALVGHEPGLSNVAAILCGRVSFRMLQKGEIVAIERGKLAWTLAPGDAARRSRE